MPLTDVQRRTLANLSIPRNVEDLTTQLRPHVVKPAAEVDALLRNGLSEHGWVAKVGTDVTDPAKLAAQVQKKRALMDLPDDKAETYARRMLRPDLSWRTSGDLWMLTEEGLAELHKPLSDAPPMERSQLQATIDAEWARVLREPFDPDTTSLGDKLLEDEFHAWYRAVSSEFAGRWPNVRLRAPMAGGASGWTDTFEIKIIDHENQKTAMPALVAPWFMALSILAFTDADTGTTADNGSHVPTYTGWARKSVAATDMPAATSGAGSAANTSAIIFAACTAGTSTILAFGNCDTVTTGELRKWGDCASTVISTTQTPAQFAVGAYVTSAA